MGVLFGALLAGCGDDSPRQDLAGQPRPVAVLRLAERDFIHESNLTGSVGLYREERIGFEVSGRVLWVLDLGLEVHGPVLDEAGTLIARGDVVAAIDDTRYRLQVETLQARLAAEEQNLESVNAELDRAIKTLNRQQRILDQGAGNQQAVDDATSAYGSLLARQRQQQARIKETQEQLNQAQEDLKDAVLFAPVLGPCNRHTRDPRRRGRGRYGRGHTDADGSDPGSGGGVGGP